MSEPTTSALSRRGFLLAGAAGASAPLLPAALGEGGPSGWVPLSHAATALPRVRPIWSQRAYEAFGVCSHPNFGKSVYKYTSQWMAALAGTRASYFRGMYSHGITATRTTTRLARDHGISWGMTVCPTLAYKDADLVRRLRHIADNAADICLYVEGVNEPNYVRGGGSPPADWPQRTVAKQKLIWQAVKADPRLSHVKVVGPSLQAVVGKENHYKALRDAGIVRYMDYAGIHRYHGGRYPDHLIDERLAWIDRYWGGKPTWITETGYTNALARKRGHNPVPEDVSAAYAPSALLEAVDRGCKVTWFELLDDPDPGAKDEIESNFGMFAIKDGMAPPWRAKPVVATMRSFLGRLEDPGPAYDPPSIGLRVTSQVDDVRRTVVARRDGSVTLHLRRATNCWHPVDQKRISVKTVPVRVETAKGTRTVWVDHRVTSIGL